MGIVKKSKLKKTSTKSKEFNSTDINKQILGDLEKKISLHLDSFLVLTEEGEPTQIAMAQQKAKSELLKFGPQMSKIAEKVGGELPEVVDDFLDSINTILHGSSGMLDEEKISHCVSKTEELKSQLNL